MKLKAGSLPLISEHKKRLALANLLSVYCLLLFDRPRLSSPPPLLSAGADDLCCGASLPDSTEPLLLPSFDGADILPDSDLALPSFLGILLGVSILCGALSLLPYEPPEFPFPSLLGVSILSGALFLLP